MSKTTTSPILWLPSAANGISLTPSATAWVDGAWVELTASAPSVLYPAYLAVLPNNGNVVSQLSTEIDVGVGGSGSEVVVATIRFRTMADQWGPTSTVPFGVIYASIAAGSRVALRVRHNATGNTNVYRVALGYFASLGGATGWTPTSPTVAPMGSTFVTVTSGASAWTFGAWVEILAAASVTSNILVTGILPTAVTVPHELQIGTGGAGSETDRLTLPVGTTSGGGHGLNYVRFPRPLCVNAGTRLSVRTRTATTLETVFPTLWYTVNP